MSWIQRCFSRGGRRQLNLISSLSKGFYCQRFKSTREIQWLWEADRTVQDFHEACLKGTRMGSFEITFNTDRRLQDGEFLQALKQIQRNLPSLQVCLRRRNNVLWFCQPPELQIDFKVMEKDISTRSVTYQILKEGYQDSDFSQWKARLIPKERQAMSFNPVIETTYPFQYDLVFTGHHGWMDGIDGLVMLRFLFHILDDIMSGKTLSDEVHGSFEQNLELSGKMNSIRDELLQDKSRLENVQKTLPPQNHIPLLLKAFPKPKVKEAYTKHITCVLDPALLQNFQMKSKEARVTFNSSFVTVIIAAIIELVTDRGLVQDSYTVVGNVHTNLRRYIKPSKNQHLFGLYSNLMSYALTVDKNLRHHFWDYSKKVNQELHDLLKQGFPLVQRVAKDLIEEGLPPTDYLTNIRPSLHDFCITNLGDVSYLLPSGEHVQITNLASLNFIHNFIHSNFHEIATFRGKSYYTLTYATNYFSDELANLFMNKVISLLKDISQ